MQGERLAPEEAQAADAIDHLTGQSDDIGDLGRRRNWALLENPRPRVEPEIGEILDEAGEALLAPDRRQLDNEGALTAMAREEALVLEPAQGLAHSFPTHAELGAERVLRRNPVPDLHAALKAAEQDVPDLKILRKRRQKTLAHKLSQCRCAMHGWADISSSV